MGNCFRSNGSTDGFYMSGDVAIGQNQPLIQEQEEWTSDVPLTEGQLRGKRDTFWETAPVYEGRKEIWDALRAACEAVEEGDFELAQAIVDGASVSLPRGRLTECYDELGSRYVIPKYCISKPTNIALPGQHSDDEDNEPDSSTQLLGGSSPSTTTTTTAYKRKPHSQAQSKQSTTNVKVRLSSTGKDVKIALTGTERVRDLKRRLETEHNIDPKRVTMLYSGRVLGNNVLVKDLAIPKGYVVQAVVS